MGSSASENVGLSVHLRSKLRWESPLRQNQSRFNGKNADPAAADDDRFGTEQHRGLRKWKSSVCTARWSRFIPEQQALKAGITMRNAVASTKSSAHGDGSDMGRKLAAGPRLYESKFFVDAPRREGDGKRPDEPRPTYHQMPAVTPPSYQPASQGAHSHEPRLQFRVAGALWSSSRRNNGRRGASAPRGPPTVRLRTAAGITTWESITARPLIAFL